MRRTRRPETVVTTQSDDTSYQDPLKKKTPLAVEGCKEVTMLTEPSMTVDHCEEQCFV